MALSPPERNHYFFGKLLDVEQLEKEQRYFNGKRWLLNRLVTGSGVVCGLNVVAGENGEVVIQPGVAIDALGREIIVVDEHSIDPSQLTDDVGNPTGEPLSEGHVEICLAYGETPTDPVAVLVPDCDTPNGCAHSTIREEYAVLVRTAGDSPEPTECGLTEFPLPVDGALAASVCQRLRRACPQQPYASADACVPVARVNVPVTDENSIHPCEGVAVVYSNTLLYELLLCLAGRVTALARGLILRYAFGDNQTAEAGRTLSEPLGVELVDGEGNPAPDVTVEFEVRRGDGRLGRSATLRDAAPASPHEREDRSLSVKTDKAGRASVLWTLGRKPIQQQVIARAVGTPLTVAFRAKAIKT